MLGLQGNTYHYLIGEFHVKYVRNVKNRYFYQNTFERLIEIDSNHDIIERDECRVLNYRITIVVPDQKILKQQLDNNCI